LNRNNEIGLKQLGCKGETGGFTCACRRTRNNWGYWDL